MQRLAAEHVANLVAAARAGGDGEIAGRGLAQLGQHAQFADLERHVVMLGLVAERTGQAAAGRIEAFDREARHQLQRGDARRRGVERLLVAMGVEHGLGRDRRRRITPKLDRRVCGG